MIRNVDPLALRRRLGRKTWGTPTPYGPDGWRLDALDGQARVIVSASTVPGEADQVEWVHASMSRAASVPTYDDLVALHAAVWPEGTAYQVFVPPSEHINIHPYALHLWGRLDGARVLPDFGQTGSI